MYDTEIMAASAWDQAALVFRAEGERDTLQLNLPNQAGMYNMQVRGLGGAHVPVACVLLSDHRPPHLGVHVHASAS